MESREEGDGHYAVLIVQTIRVRDVVFVSFRCQTFEDEDPPEVVIDIRDILAVLLHQLLELRAVNLGPRVNILKIIKMDQKLAKTRLGVDIVKPWI